MNVVAEVDRATAIKELLLAVMATIALHCHLTMMVMADYRPKIEVTGMLLMTGIAIYLVIAHDIVVSELLRIAEIDET